MITARDEWEHTGFEDLYRALRASLLASTG